MDFLNEYEFDKSNSLKVEKQVLVEAYYSGRLYLTITLITYNIFNTMQINGEVFNEYIATN